MISSTETIYRPENNRIRILLTFEGYETRNSTRIEVFNGNGINEIKNLSGSGTFYSGVFDFERTNWVSVSKTEGEIGDNYTHYTINCYGPEGKVGVRISFSTNQHIEIVPILGKNEGVISLSLSEHSQFAILN